MTTSQQQTITLDQDGRPPYTFRGTLVASALGRGLPQAQDAMRWYDVRVYQHEDGGLIVHWAYTTQLRGERCRAQVEAFPDAQAACEALKNFDPCGRWLRGYRHQIARSQHHGMQESTYVGRQAILEDQIREGYGLQVETLERAILVGADTGATRMQSVRQGRSEPRQASPNRRCCGAHEDEVSREYCENHQVSANQ